MSQPSLTKLLDDLNDPQASRFDPVRLVFIQSLCQRFAAPVNANNQPLEDKARAAIKAYNADLNKARKRAEKTLKRLEKNFPEQAETVRTAFKQGDFRLLERLGLSLHKQQSRGDGLTSLNRRINTTTQADQPEQEASSFEQMLQEQEAQLQLGCVVDTEELASDGSDDQTSEQAIELRSVKVFRESMRHHKIDRVIEKAISTWPENPGPHNPHMLVIKAMAHMRELSPDYLRRLASYVETLIWLEKNISRVDDSKSLPQN